MLSVPGGYVSVWLGTMTGAEFDEAQIEAKLHTIALSEAKTPRKVDPRNGGHDRRNGGRAGRGWRRRGGRAKSYKSAWELSPGEGQKLRACLRTFAALVYCGYGPSNTFFVPPSL
jgi:hypothetical protein